MILNVNSYTMVGIVALLQFSIIIITFVGRPYYAVMIFIDHLTYPYCSVVNAKLYPTANTSLSTQDDS